MAENEVATKAPESDAAAASTSPEETTAQSGASLGVSEALLDTILNYC
jgi:hypothetical protein